MAEQVMTEHSKLRRWVRGLGTGVGLVLLGVAIWFALSSMSWQAMGSVHWAVLPGLAGLIGLNIVLSGALFWVMTLSFDASPRVGFWRMVDLIAVSGLLNYVPVVRAGLWGRAAYLKVRHGLPVRQSAVMVLAAVGLTVGVALIVFGLWVSVGLAWVVFGSAVVLIAAAGLWQVVAGRVMGRAVCAGWSWVVLRYVDTLVMAGRLWLAMWAVGQPIGFDEALAAGSAALVVRIVGLTPNGLGLSEWVAAWLLSVGMGGGGDEWEAGQMLAVYMPGVLLDRGVEVLVTLVWGGFGVWRLRLCGCGELGS